jgi:cytoskeletal protein RodZ
MQPALRLYHWLLFLAVNVVVSTLASLLVVQAFIQTVNRSTLPAAQTVSASPTPASTPATSQSASAPPPADLPAPAAAEPRAPASPANLPRVRISNIIYPGQRAREVVVLANEGEVVDLTGWTLSTPRGVTYTFGSVVFPNNSFINLYTTSGVDTPTSLFWNQPQAVWQVGDVATLKRGDEVIATYTVR